MKKKKLISNIIMVAIILVIATAGILTAVHFMQEEDTGLGSEFQLPDPPKLELVSDGATNICTIEIRCDTILNNLDNLTPEKAPYVPKNGIILEPIQVEFAEGETVFEVLQRVCEAYDLQIEFSYTPLYGSYYIEGINHLYEFDCGSQSGWMYKVDGWFPNYGCSEYKLKNGQSIVWCYTCNGLGEDVGSVWMGDAE